jgi:hypothetical protein
VLIPVRPTPYAWRQTPEGRDFAVSTRSRIIDVLVAVGVCWCLAQLREVVSVGTGLGGESRIVCDMVVSDLA